MWVEFFRPVLIVLQLLGFSIGPFPALPVELPAAAAPQPGTIAWTPDARADFIAAVGGLIALEGICQLRYDQAGFAAFIEKIVPASDHHFFGELTRMRRQVTREMKRVPETERTLMCLQASRSAKDFGFLR